MKKLPGPRFTVRPRGVPRAAPNTNALLTSPESPDFATIDETQRRILSVIAKARAGAQGRARVGVGARGPVSGGRGMVDAEMKDGEDGKREKGVKKEGSNEGMIETEEKGEEGKVANAKTERRRRFRRAKKQREAEQRETEKNEKDRVDCADAEGVQGGEVLGVYWAAVARLERRIEGLRFFDPPLSGYIGRTAGDSGALNWGREVTG